MRRRLISLLVGLALLVGSNVPPLVRTAVAMTPGEICLMLDHHPGTDGASTSVAEPCPCERDDGDSSMVNGVTLMLPGSPAVVAALPRVSGLVVSRDPACRTGFVTPQEHPPHVHA